MDENRRVKLLDSVFLKTPSNTAAVTGQTVTIECWTVSNDTIDWYVKKFGETVETLIYNGYAIFPTFKDRMHVKTSNQKGFHRDLVIERVVLGDAGIYKCISFDRINGGKSKPVSATSQLIVLDSEPKYFSNMTTDDDAVVENESFVFMCAVNYTGNWDLKFNWFLDGDAISKDSEHPTATVMDEKVQTDTSSTVSSSFLFQVSKLDNGAVLAWSMDFDEKYGKDVTMSATNVPVLSYFWNITLNVTFGPADVSISPRQDRYSFEDVLSCKADGNPKPTYKWRNSRTQEIIAVGPHLAISNNGEDDIREYSVDCIASNIVAGKTNTKTGNVLIHIKVSGISNEQITIIMGCACFVLLLIVFVVGRQYIKGCIISFASLFRRQNAAEPDLVPNAGNPLQQLDENEFRDDRGFQLEGAESNHFVYELNSQFPIYAEVNKTKNGCAASQSRSRLGQQQQQAQSETQYNAYECIEGKRADLAMTGQPTTSTKTNESENFTITGLDGTIYMDLNAIRGQKQLQQLTEPSVFKKSEYASMDHTTVTLPPSKYP